MSKPFIVVDGRVYLNAALVAEAESEVKVSSTQAEIVKALVDGELVSSNGTKLNLKTGGFFIGDVDLSSQTLAEPHPFEVKLQTGDDGVQRFCGVGLGARNPKTDWSDADAVLDRLSGAISETELGRAASLAEGDTSLGGLLDRIKALETRVLDLQADVGYREAAELRMATQIAAIEAGLSSLR